MESVPNLFEPVGVDFEPMVCLYLLSSGDMFTEEPYLINSKKYLDHYLVICISCDIKTTALLQQDVQFVFF